MQGATWKRAALLTAAGAVLFSADGARGQELHPGGEGVASVRTLVAVRAEDAFRIDGRLDEHGWSTAPVATGFVQRQPNPGMPATRETEVRVLYDGRSIYVGARLFDEPDSVAAQFARRDATGSYSDWFLVSLDSYNDNRTAFVFGVNPRGVKQDLLISEDNRSDQGWDAVWEVAARPDSTGWTVEFRIPLSQLRFSPRESVWGINFQRIIARRDERSYWSPTPPDAPGVVSRFGDLTGLVGLRVPGRLELRPYSLSRLARAPGESANPFYNSSDLSVAAGADLKYGLTTDLTLTATINPDFGQVEADPSQVNLTAYEIFFPERRPFFVEGSDIFGFGLGNREQLFYSRRIGRAPRGPLPSDAQFRDVPEASTILGAAKFSGKTRSGWSIGVLDAITANEEGRFVDGQGTVGRREIEPLTNYGVVRVRKDFERGRSTLGGIITATNRRIDNPDLRFLPSAAYAGGVDGRHRFGGNYEVSGWVLGSHVSGDVAALRRVQAAAGRYFQRPDADHLRFDSTRTSLSGLDASLHLGKVGGGHWRGGVMGHARSPGFEVNDLGYMRATDRLEESAYLGYEEFRPKGAFRRWNLYFNQYAGWSWGGETALSGLNVNGSFELTNFWSGNASIERSLPILSLDALRGGPALRTPAATNVNVGLASDPRKKVTSSVSAGMWRENETGSRIFGVGAGMGIRPSARTQLSLSPSVSYREVNWQYVSEPVSDRYLFGAIEQWTTSLTMRLNYTFTPDLSLQFYAQPFVSAGEYSGFREVADPRAERFGERLRLIPTSEIRPCTTSGETFYGVRPDRPGCATSGAANAEFDYTFGNPDFNVKQLRSNLVLRWEYRPGSTAFLVWSQGRNQSLSDGSFAPVRDFGRLFGMNNGLPAPSTNVLLLKVSYWFAP